MSAPDFDRIRAINCPSTHCNRREECCSPRECCSPAKSAAKAIRKLAEEQT